MKKKHKQNLPGLKKSIILLSILGRDISKKVLPFLGDKEKSDLLQEKSKGSPFTASDEKSVLSEYNRFMKKKLLESGPSNLELVYLFVIIILLVTLFEIFAIISRPGSAFKHFVEVGGIYLSIYPFVVYAIYAVTRSNILKTSLRTLNPIKDTLLAVAGGIILFLLMAASTIASGKALTPGHETGFYFVILLLVAGYVGPVLEEFFFRHVIYGYIRQKLNLIAGLSISSLLFAIMHTPDSFIALPFYFLAGCILAWLYSHSKRLFAPVLAHSIGNILVLLY